MFVTVVPSGVSASWDAETHHEGSGGRQVLGEMAAFIKMLDGDPRRGLMSRQPHYRALLLPPTVSRMHRSGAHSKEHSVLEGNPDTTTIPLQRIYLPGLNSPY